MGKPNIKQSIISGTIYAIINIVVLLVSNRLKNIFAMESFMSLVLIGLALGWLILIGYLLYGVMKEKNKEKHEKSRWEELKNNDYLG